MRLEIACPRPSNRPVNGVANDPIGVKPARLFQLEVTLAFRFDPSAKLPPKLPFMPCKSDPLILPAAPRLLITVK